MFPGVLNSQTYASLSDVAKVNQQIRLFVYAAGMDDNLISFTSVQAAHDKLTQLGVVIRLFPFPAITPGTTGESCWWISWAGFSDDGPAQSLSRIAAFFVVGGMAKA